MCVWGSVCVGVVSEGRGVGGWKTIISQSWSAGVCVWGGGGGRGMYVWLVVVGGTMAQNIKQLEVLVGGGKEGNIHH